MEQLEHGRVVADVIQWDGEIERLQANLLKLRMQHVVTEEGLEELRTDLSPGLKAVEISDLEDRKTLRHIEPTVGRETHLNGFGESQRRRVRARAAKSHRMIVAPCWLTAEIHESTSVMPFDLKA